MEAFLKVFLNLLVLVEYAMGSPQISLEYNPYPRPSYNPNPGQNTAHTVPPGKPWPASLEEYNSFSQTSSVRPPSTVENRFQETTTPKKETARPNLDYGKPPASLEYNPYPLPSYNPNPGENTALTVPPGKPWPANPEAVRPTASSNPTLENRFPETTTPRKEYGKPPISLEYNPYPLPSFHPNPGQNTAHTVPPGKPWPANAEDYNSFSQTSSVRPPSTVENRFQETTTPKKETARPNLDYGKPPASLEYNPYPLPSYNPNPGENTAHTVPPGKPWPANPEDYNSFSQTSSIRPKPMVVENRFQETTTTARPNLDYGKPPASLEYNPYPLPSYNPNPGENTALTIPPGKPWPADPPANQTNLNNRIQEQQKPTRPEMYLIYPEDLWFIYLSDRFREMISHSNTGAKETLVLDYRPSRPNPIEIERLENQNRPAPIQQVAENPFQEEQDQVQPLIVLDYKPNPPFYRPGPTEKPQVVPPGEPWPANPEDYVTFGQSKPSANRVGGPPSDQIPPLMVVDYKPNRPSPTEIEEIPWPTNPEDHALFGQSQPQKFVENRLQEAPPEQVQPLIVLDYKPNRPFYRPSPTEIQQIVPPGKPWPANQEDYATFGQAQQNIENRFQETTSSPPGGGQDQPLIVLDYKPNRPFYRPSPTEIQQIVPPGKPWPANQEDYATFSGHSSIKPEQNIENRLQETSSPPPGGQVQPLVVLDYKPNRPFYRPSPTEVQQVVPPGKPWPATPTQQTIENRFEEMTTPKEPPIETKPQLVLDYKPSRPSFHPNPGGVVGQVVPPGKPLPATPTQQTGEELITSQPIARPNPVGQGVPSPLGGGNQNVVSGRPPQNQGQTVLEYYPVNAINQGSSIGQIVRPGKPWPASSEDYNASNLRSTENIVETKTEDGRPVAENSRPMAENLQPSTEGSQPMAKDSQPMAKDSQPMTKDSQPITEVSQSTAKDPQQSTTENMSELMLFTSKLLENSLPTLLPLQQDSNKDQKNKK